MKIFDQFFIEQHIKKLITEKSKLKVNILIFVKNSRMIFFNYNTAIYLFIFVAVIVLLLLLLSYKLMIKVVRIC